MKTTFAILLLAAGAAYAQTSGAGSTNSDPARPHRGSGPAPEAAQERSRRILELLNRGRAAEKAGDDAAAEACYLQAGELRPGTPVAALRLAPLYDKMGRDRDAYAQYRLAVADYGDRASMNRDDPWLLARYGALCERFGTREEALMAYAIAAKLSHRERTPEPETVPRNESFASVKSAGFAAAALQYRGQGKIEQAMAAIETAVAADPQYWVARYYHAYLLSREGKWEEAEREALLAAKLGPTEAKAHVKWLQRARHLRDETGKVPPSIPLRPPVEVKPA